MIMYLYGERGRIPFSDDKTQKGVDKAMANVCAFTAQRGLILPASFVNTVMQKEGVSRPFFTGELRLHALSESGVTPYER